MKHLKYIILLVCFVFASSVFSQKIIKVKKPYVLIDISRESGYRVGDELLVYHPGEEDEDKLVGVVELVVFKADECAAKIIKESVSTKIQVGDVVAPYRTSAQNKDKARVLTRPSTPSAYQGRLSGAGLGPLAGKIGRSAADGGVPGVLVRSASRLCCSGSWQH